MTGAPKYVTSSDPEFDHGAGQLQRQIRGILALKSRDSALIALASELIHALEKAPADMRRGAVPRIIAALKELEE